MNMVSILLGCILGALLLLSVGLGIHAYVMGSVYKQKVRQVQLLSANEWDGGSLRKRLGELDKHIGGTTLFWGAGGALVAIFNLKMANEGYLNIAFAVILGVVVSITFFINQLRLFRLIRQVMEEDFLLGNYISMEKFEFLLSLNEDEMSHATIAKVLASRVTAPHYLESLTVLDDLLDESFETRNILQTEVDEEFALERAELMEAFLTSRETLSPLLYALLMAVGHNEPVSQNELKRKDLKERAMTLHRMASIFNKEESHYDTPAFNDLNQVIEDEEVPVELKVKAKETLDIIQEKIEDALVERKEENVRLDAEASIETARRLYGIGD